MFFIEHTFWSACLVTGIMVMIMIVQYGIDEAPGKIFPLSKKDIRIAMILMLLAAIISPILYAITKKLF